jgi:F0F1-type ATP synthase assembly protein I
VVRWICYASGMKRWEAALRFVGVGWYIGLCIVLGVLGGRWLDRQFDTGVILTIVGLILGVIAAIYGVYRMLVPLLGNKHNKEDS